MTKIHQIRVIRVPFIDKAQSSAFGLIGSHRPQSVSFGRLKGVRVEVAFGDGLKDGFTFGYIQRR